MPCSDYFKAQGVDARAFDTQQPDGNLKRFHAGQTEIVDLSTSDGQIMVFNSVPKHAVTVIDIQAGLLTPTLNLLSEIGFLDMVKEGKLNVSVLHIIGSTGPVAQRNRGHRQNPGRLAALHRHQPHQRRRLLRGHRCRGHGSAEAGTGRIDIPKMDERATEHVEAASTSFDDYAKNG